MEPHTGVTQGMIAYRYYDFLSALETALPVGKDRGGVQMAFSWGDAFQPRDRPQSTLVTYEKARPCTPLPTNPSASVSVPSRLG